MVGLESASTKMASVPEPSDAGFPPLAFQHRKVPMRIMTEEIVVISDDEEGPDKPKDIMISSPGRRRLKSASQSPVLSKDGKRQKVNHDDTELPEAWPIMLSSDDEVEVVTVKEANAQPKPASTPQPDPATIARDIPPPTLDTDPPRPVAPSTTNLVHPQIEPPVLDSSKTLRQQSSNHSNSSKKPPYVWDHQFDLLMYCGPGYESFPIPVDSDPDLRQICSAYDQRTSQENLKKRIEFACERLERHAFDFNEDYLDGLDVELSESEPKQPTAMQKMCLDHIKEVFKDIDQDFVLEKIRCDYESYSFGDEDIEIMPDAQKIISEILEMQEYPKVKKVLSVKEDELIGVTGRTIKVGEEHRFASFYRDESVILLAKVFDHVPTHFISKTICDKKTLFSTFLELTRLENEYFLEKQNKYRRLREPRKAIEAKYLRRSRITYPKFQVQLVTELQAAKQQARRDALQKAEDLERLQEEADNLSRHKEAGTILECQICFDDEVPINRSVACKSEIQQHYFCYGCIVQLANTQVGLMKHELKCMEGGGCDANLDMDTVSKAIPIKTFDRLQLNQQQAELATAFPEGLDQCPFCDFKALCGTVEEEPVFSCQHPECCKASCRKCHELVHLMKTCAQAKEDRGLGARHKIEEARSEAMMRTCPKCNKKIIKEYGCNKMKCSCGGVLCYVCNADLSAMRDGYAHFSSDVKCKLHDEIGRSVHDDDADQAEREAIKAAKALDMGVDENMLQIETGKISKQTPAPLPRFGDHGFPPAFPRGDQPARAEPFAAMDRMFGYPPFDPAAHEMFMQEAFRPADYARYRNTMEPPLMAGVDPLFAQNFNLRYPPRYQDLEPRILNAAGEVVQKPRPNVADIQPQRPVAARPEPEVWTHRRIRPVAGGEADIVPDREADIVAAAHRHRQHRHELGRRRLSANTRHMPPKVPDANYLNIRPAARGVAEPAKTAHENTRDLKAIESDQRRVDAEADWYLGWDLTKFPNHRAERMERGVIDKSRTERK